jgi:hypothetical protein
MDIFILSRCKKSDLEFLNYYPTVEIMTKKARPEKSRPLLTYEKHQVQRYKKIFLLQH